MAKCYNCGYPWATPTGCPNCGAKWKRESFGEKVIIFFAAIIAFILFAYFIGNR